MSVMLHVKVKLIKHSIAGAQPFTARHDFEFAKSCCVQTGWQIVNSCKKVSALGHACATIMKREHELTHVCALCNHPRV